MIPGQHKDGCITTTPHPGSPGCPVGKCKLQQGQDVPAQTALRPSDAPGEALPIPDTSRGRAGEGGSTWSCRWVTVHNHGSHWPQSKALVAR